MITNLAAGVQAFTSNAFLVRGERTALVDVGANFDVVARLREDDIEPDAVAITHAHRDHVDNLAAVTAAFDVEVWGFDSDREGIDRRLADGDEIVLGDRRYAALHTPGHGDDHLCLHSTDGEILFSGDLLFRNGSVGRTDLEGGDRDLLIDSVDRVRDRVDDRLQQLHAGHGASVRDDPLQDIEIASRLARTG